MVSQIALSLLMLVGAGLFVRTLSNLQSIQLGFNRDNLLLFRMNAHQAGHKEPEIVEFYSDLQKQFSAIPGVRGRRLFRIRRWWGKDHGSRPRLRSAIRSKDPDWSPHILMAGTRFLRGHADSFAAGACD